MFSDFLSKARNRLSAIPIDVWVFFLVVFILGLIVGLLPSSNKHQVEYVGPPQYQQQVAQPQYQPAPPQYADQQQYAPQDYQQAPPPQVVYQQAPASAPTTVVSGGGHDGSDMLMAGTMGYLLGRGSGNPGNYGGYNGGYGGGYNHSVTNKTTIINNHPTNPTVSAPRIPVRTSPPPLAYNFKRSPSPNPIVVSRSSPSPSRSFSFNKTTRRSR